MSFINYDYMTKTTDIRIVKTRRVIFSSILSLLKHKQLSEISVTELCQTALLNRKTFYMHYKTIEDAFRDIEKYTIAAYIERLKNRNIISSYDFNPKEFILETNSIVIENLDSFNAVYPYFKRGTFMRHFGAEMGTLSKKYAQDRHSEAFTEAYVFSFIFTACGLLTSYFDWIDFGRQLPIEQLAQLAANALSTPLQSVLTSK